MERGWACCRVERAAGPLAEAARLGLNCRHYGSLLERKLQLVETRFGLRLPCRAVKRFQRAPETTGQPPVPPDALSFSHPR